jgi:hypothetical protein
MTSAKHSAVISSSDAMALTSLPIKGGGRGDL